MSAFSTFARNVLASFGAVSLVQTYRQVLRHVTGTKTVALIQFKGIIADQSGKLIARDYENSIKQAYKTPGISAVCLDINVQGGSPVQARRLYDMVMHHKSKSEIPTYAFAGDLATSGGYMLLCAGDEVYVSPDSLVGSIGVLYSSFDLSGLMDRLNVKRRLYTTGALKASGDPFSPDNEQGIEMIKKAQAVIHKNFVDLVKDARGAAFQKAIESGSMIEDNLFDGSFWVGSDAVDLGLADYVGERLQIIDEKFGPNVMTIDLTPTRWSLFDRLGIYTQPLVSTDASIARLPFEGDNGLEISFSPLRSHIRSGL